MKVMMFGKATKQTEASQPPTEEALLAIQKFNEELEKAGVLLDLGGLTPSSRGVRVQYSGDDHLFARQPNRTDRDRGNQQCRWISSRYEPSSGSSRIHQPPGPPRPR